MGGASFLRKGARESTFIYDGAFVGDVDLLCAWAGGWGCSDWGMDDGKWRMLERRERGKMDFGFGVASEA